MAGTDDPRRRRTGSRSRTGLFPWGRTYQVPVHDDGMVLRSATPCHGDEIDVPAHAADRPAPVRCPTCGRRWHVQPDMPTAPDPPTTATWTA